MDMEKALKSKEAKLNEEIKAEIENMILEGILLEKDGNGKVEAHIEPEESEYANFHYGVNVLER